MNTKSGVGRELLPVRLRVQLRRRGRGRGARSRSSSRARASSSSVSSSASSSACSGAFASTTTWRPPGSFTTRSGRSEPSVAVARGRLLEEVAVLEHARRLDGAAKLHLAPAPAGRGARSAVARLRVSRAQLLAAATRASRPVSSAAYRRPGELCSSAAVCCSNSASVVVERRRASSRRASRNDVVVLARGAARSCRLKRSSQPAFELLHERDPLLGARRARARPARASARRAGRARRADDGEPPTSDAEDERRRPPSGPKNGRDRVGRAPKTGTKNAGADKPCGPSAPAERPYAAARVAGQARRARKPAASGLFVSRRRQVSPTRRCYRGRAVAEEDAHAPPRRGPFRRRSAALDGQGQARRTTGASGC